MSSKPVQIIAHRGARAFAPENTTAAIDKAAQAKADAVELDVQVTADSHLIVTHDDNLVRCSNVCTRYPDRKPWRVSNFTLAEIRSLDAGSWFVSEIGKPIEQRQPFLQSLTDRDAKAWISEVDLAHYASGDVKVPTLSECLVACGILRFKAHLELKAIPRFYPDLAQKVVEAAEHSDMHDSVVISSFDHQQLAYVRSLTTKIRTAVLTSDRLYRPVEYLMRVGAQSYCPGCFGEYDTIGFGSVDGKLDERTIKELQEAGYDVYVWTENDPARMKDLIRLGVTGIFTDYPNRLREILIPVKVS